MRALGGSRSPGTVEWAGGGAREAERVGMEGGYRRRRGRGVGVLGTLLELERHFPWRRQHSVAVLRRSAQSADGRGNPSALHVSFLFSDFSVGKLVLSSKNSQTSRTQHKGTSII